MINTQHQFSIVHCEIQLGTEFYQQAFLPSTCGVCVESVSSKCLEFDSANIRTGMQHGFQGWP